eukprot:COSAG04_NODE_545_length_12819_cov_3.351179_10_plen_139_part_00
MGDRADMRRAISRREDEEEDAPPAEYAGAAHSQTFDPSQFAQVRRDLSRVEAGRAAEQRQRSGSDPTAAQLARMTEQLERVSQENQRLHEKVERLEREKRPPSVRAEPFAPEPEAKAELVLIRGLATRGPSCVGRPAG